MPSTDIVSMVIRKYEQSVLQSLCSICQHILDFFFLVSLYAIHVHWECAKHNKSSARVYKESPEFLPSMLSNQNINMYCLNRGRMPL